MKRILTKQNGLFILILGCLIMVFYLSGIEEDPPIAEKSPAVGHKNDLVTGKNSFTFQASKNGAGFRPNSREGSGEDEQLRSLPRNIPLQSSWTTDMSSVAESDRIQARNAAINRMRQQALREKRLLYRQRQQQAQNPWNLNKSIAALSEQIREETNPAKKTMLVRRREGLYSELRETMRMR